MKTPTYHTGDHVRSLVHRHGVLRITPGNVESAPLIPLGTYISNPTSGRPAPQVAGGAVHTPSSRPRPTTCVR